MFDFVYDDSNVQKAKSILKRFYLLRVLTLALLTIAYIAVGVYFDYRYEVIIIGMAVYFWLSSWIQRKLHQSMIANVLHVKMDAPLFYQLMYQGKYFGEAGLQQILAHYFVGNYENVLAACKQKLSEPRWFRKYKYRYLNYMANCYFDMGDDDQLREVCDLIRRYQRDEKKNIAFRVVDFYEAYLNRDFDGCWRYLEGDGATELYSTIRAFYAARVMLLQGDTEKAIKEFDRIAVSAPNIQIGVLCRRAVCSLQEGKTYAADFEKLTGEVDFRLTPRWKFVSFFRMVYIASIIVLAAFLLYTTADYFGLLHTQMSIQELLVQEYDSVAVLDEFGLENDDVIADNMFIAKTDEYILIGSTYYYDNDPRMYYEIQVKKKISYLKTQSYDTFFFSCITSDYTGSGIICTNPAYIPDEFCYSTSFELDGQIYYLVIYDLSKPSWY